MTKILLAGATGYLGGYILKEIEKSEYQNRIVVRNKSKLKSFPKLKSEIVLAEVTKPDTLRDICEGIDIVISTVGITKQKEGLTYLDVDYQSNKNLLSEALKRGVKKFVYVSVLNGERLKNLKICEAKERFVNELKSSGIDYCIIRPNGFFSDMTEFYNMAKKGRIYLFGDGEHKANPIHGEDLAKIIMKNVETGVNEIKIGGPETLTQNQIAEIAFKVLGKKIKTTHMPDCIRKSILSLVRTFMSSKIYGPIEFFLTVIAMDMVAPEYGNHTLKAYFENL